MSQMFIFNTSQLILPYKDTIIIPWSRKKRVVPRETTVAKQKNWPQNVSYLACEDWMKV